MSRLFQRRNFCPRSSAIDPSTAMSWLVKGSQPSERFEPKLTLAPAQLRAARGAALDDELVDDLLNDLGWQDLGWQDLGWQDLGWQVEFASSPLGQIAKLLLGSPLRPALGGFLADLVAVVPDRVHGVA